MDEEISIIDTNARNEKIKNFFIKNKKILIIITSILLILIIENEYMGCFGDHGHDRVFSKVIVGSVNHKTCAVFCYGYIYMGLENGYLISLIFYCYFFELL